MNIKGLLASILIMAVSTVVGIFTYKKISGEGL